MTDRTKFPQNEDELEKLSTKEEVSDFVKTAFLAILLALVIRTFLYEPFNIPSGSMLPTLKVGDYLFVSKPAYGYSQYSFPFGLASFEGRHYGALPKRGDIVVFKLPSDTSTDYIKRVIGLPGDTIQMIRGRLYINGKMVERELIGPVDLEQHHQAITEYTEILPDGTRHSIYEEGDMQPLDNTELFKVPDNHYFMMGDNRDNSQDSRVQSLVGFVPYDNFVGRADFLFFSVDESASLFKPWEWPFKIRYNRILMGLTPDRPAVAADE